MEAAASDGAAAKVRRRELKGLNRTRKLGVANCNIQSMQYRQLYQFARAIGLRDTSKSWPVSHLIERQLQMDLDRVGECPLHPAEINCACGKNGQRQYQRSSNQRPVHCSVRKQGRAHRFNDPGQWIE